MTTFDERQTGPARRLQRVRHELRQRRVRVSAVERVSPGFVRVAFGGDELAGFVSLSFDDHVKFMFAGPDGEVVRRDYTPLAYDPGRRELSIEFALHADGPAGDWAAAARPGQEVVIGGPRGSMIVPTDYAWHLLAGDASALPAIQRRVEELPAGARALVLVQVEHAEDRRDFATAAAVEAHWVQGAQAWLDALRGLRLPPGEGFAWCAGEAATMRAARGILLEHHRQPREALKVAAYWKRGTADFHERLDD